MALLLTAPQEIIYSNRSSDYSKCTLKVKSYQAINSDTSARLKSIFTLLVLQPCATNGTTIFFMLFSQSRLFPLKASGFESAKE